MNRAYTVLISSILIITVMLIPPIGNSNSLSQENGCEECHSNFKAFAVILDAPEEVPVDYGFEYKVVVKNPGEHTLEDVEAVIDITSAPHLRSKTEPGEPFHDEVSGTVGPGITMGYTFPVEEGAFSAVVSLDGNEGILGRNDIDLSVTSPNGEQWVSESPEADERVELDERDIQRGGYGEYQAEVIYFIGPPSVSFTLTIDVEYGAGQMRQKGPDLGPGEKYTFNWSLKSISRGDNQIGVRVSGTAYYDHEEGENRDRHEYFEERESSLKVGDKLVYNPPEEEEYVSVSIILMERITGLLSGTLLFVSILLSGLVKPVNSRIEKMIAGRKNRVKWHCRFSFVLLVLSALHGTFLPFSPYASSLRGLALGLPSLLILGTLGYAGWQQQQFKQRWGLDKWRRIHLMLSVVAVIMVVLHGALDGSDFAWLR
ncbi:MAG: hypothetical protein JSW28_04475 [Thermoplasmata archaeon]|nr:MAG: hypothetical protein JSW28_04475 [Thermoplasmata archaeon]